jgi:hypothetical protein
VAGDLHLVSLATLISISDYTVSNGMMISKKKKDAERSSCGLICTILYHHLPGETSMDSWCSSQRFKLDSSQTSQKHYRMSQLAQFMATEDVVKKYYKV